MAWKPRFNGLNAVAFDLDGTIYLGNSIIAGAAETIAFLQDNGIRVFYFTNSSTRTRMELLRKLFGMGLTVSIEQIYTSAYACAMYARDNHLRDVYCIGTDGLKAELGSNGVNVTDDVGRVEGVIVGLDPDFSYDMLAKLTDFTVGNHTLIACNRDRSFPVEGNRLMPGCGPIVAAVEEFLDRKVDYMAGKPNTYMMELLARERGLGRNEIAVVGDSYASDIEMAKRYDCRSFLVTGEPNPAVTGTVVIRDIAELGQLLFEAE